MVALEEKYAGLEQLPQFPAVTTKLMRVMASDAAGIAEIAGLVRADAALTSELLRTVNSALHGARTPVGSVQRALLVLGFDELKRFVLAASMKMCFCSALRLDLFRAMWRHSLACALLSEELSVACSPSQSRDDRVYTAGLLHDIGRLGLLVAHPGEYAALLSEEGSLLRDREIGAFGLDHCEAGRWLAAKWELPDEIQRVAGGHHEVPSSAITDVEGTVRVGVLLTDFLGFDLTPPEHPYTLQQIRTLLPLAAQYRFDPDPDQIKARILDRLNAFD